MPYILNQARNPLAIAERKWAVADRIRFTKFTAGIAVLALTDDNRVIAVHLPLFDDENHLISADDIGQVVDLLQAQNYDPGSVRITGQFAVWIGSAPEAWNALMISLNPIGTFPLAEGSFGAAIGDQGRVELTF